MSHLLVYSATNSRLHADLLIVRLKRAGVSTDAISVLHPVSMRPNSTVCWIKGTAPYTLSSGEQIAVAGILGSRLNLEKKRSGGLIEALSGIGLSREQSVTVEEKLLENQIVVTVEVARESDLPTIYHTLRGVVVETVSATAVNNRLEKNSVLANRFRRVYAAADLALAAHGSFA